MVYAMGRGESVVGSWFEAECQERRFATYVAWEVGLGAV